MLYNTPAAACAAAAAGRVAAPKIFLPYAIHEHFSETAVAVACSTYLQANGIYCS
jgi:hypothetical protein